MLNGIFYAHSGLRYLVLLVGIAALAYFAYAFITRRPVDRAATLLRVGFVALLDVQVLLGLLLVFLGLWYPAMAGHLAMMVAALVVAHAASVMARRGTDAVRSHRVMLIGVALTLLLIVGGILAIGRPIFGSGRPSL
jgi:heme A synthase